MLLRGKKARIEGHIGSTKFSRASLLVYGASEGNITMNCPAHTSWGKPQVNTSKHGGKSKSKAEQQAAIRIHFQGQSTIQQQTFRYVFEEIQFCQGLLT